MLLLDVDHFKEVNDRYGHLAGDCVLREIALRLRGSSRLYDSIGRYGGEEFLIVLPNTRMENARSQAERLRGTISDSLVETAAGRIAVSVSMGLAVGTGEGPARRDALLKAADVALYRAKRQGRDRVEVAWETPVPEDNPPAPSTVVSGLPFRAG